MKNRVLVVLLLIMLFPFIKAKAGSFDSYVNWDLDKNIFAHQYKNGNDRITNLAMMEVNGKVAYCVEPGISAQKDTMYSSTYDINETNINQTNIKKVSLVGYYGYGYKNHNEKEYYMAAQELIWRFLGVENVWWTDSKYEGNTFDIEFYKNEILKLVDDYEKTPLFELKDNYIVGEEIILNDINNILDEYDIYTNDNIVKDNNNLIIKLNDENNFTLKRKSNDKSPIFYYKEGKQTIATFEYAYDFYKDYSIKASYGKIVLDKYDFSTKDKIPIDSSLSLKGAIYELFDSNNNLIDSKETDEFGTIIFDNLIYGTYYVKEKLAPAGYTLDNEVYEVLLDSDNLSVNIKSYEKIIENTINITKVLRTNENNIMKEEEGILFGVFDKNDNLLSSYTTNKDGKISFKLPYGTYILKQLSSPLGVLKADDRIIEVTKMDNIIDMVIVNELEEKIEVLPKTGKNSYFIFIESIIGVIYVFSKIYNKLS